MASICSWATLTSSVGPSSVILSSPSVNSMWTCRTNTRPAVRTARRRSPSGAQAALGVRGPPTGSRTGWGRGCGDYCGFGRNHPVPTARPLRVTRTTAEAPQHHTAQATHPRPLARGDQDSEQDRSETPRTGPLPGPLDLLQPPEHWDWSTEGLPWALGKEGPPPPPPKPKHPLCAIGFSDVTTHNHDTVTAKRGAS